MSSSLSHGLGGAATTAPAGLTLRTPPRFDGAWRDAAPAAADANEPLFVPVPAFADDRGWSLMNLLPGAMSGAGQMNFSMQYPGVVKAWHRHRLQTDFWVPVIGHLKVGVYRAEDDVAWMCVTGEQRRGVIVIPPGLWHGAAAVGAVPAGLLYYVTHAYDPAAPDEERRAHDSVPGFPWAVRHG